MTAKNTAKIEKAKELLEKVSVQGMIEIDDGAWLHTQDIMSDQEGWDEEDGSKNFDFSEAPFWITTNDGFITDIYDANDLAEYL